MSSSKLAISALLEPLGSRYSEEVRRSKFSEMWGVCKKFSSESRRGGGESECWSRLGAPREATLLKKASGDREEKLIKGGGVR